MSWTLNPTCSSYVVYATTIAVILWVWATRELAAAFGRDVVVFLIFPTLAAMWLVFATTVWSDLPAGLCGAVVASRVYRSRIRLVEGGGLPVRDLVVAEAAMIMMVYVRGSAILVVVAVHALLLGLPVIAGRWSRLPRELGMIVAGGMMFAMVLSPWSSAASNELGDPVVTTASAPLALGPGSSVSFSDDQVTAARWLRDHSAAHDFVMTNRHCQLSDAERCGPAGSTSPRTRHERS